MQTFIRYLFLLAVSIRSEGNTFRIQVDNYQTGASFKGKAGIFGDIGNDSNGLVFIRRAP